MSWRWAGGGGIREERGGVEEEDEICLNVHSVIVNSAGKNTFIDFTFCKQKLIRSLARLVNGEELFT